jgi:hypothetical protein
VPLNNLKLKQARPHQIKNREINAALSEPRMKARIVEPMHDESA